MHDAVVSHQQLDYIERRLRIEMLQSCRNLLVMSVALQAQTGLPADRIRQLAVRASRAGGTRAQVTAAFRNLLIQELKESSRGEA